MIKEFLGQLVDNYDLPVDLVEQIKDIIDDQTQKFGGTSYNEDESRIFQGQHDFLAQLPLSPK